MTVDVRLGAAAAATLDALPRRERIWLVQALSLLARHPPEAGLCSVSTPGHLAACEVDGDPPALVLVYAILEADASRALAVRGA
jgi:hypothetical protein